MELALKQLFGADVGGIINGYCEWNDLQAHKQKYKQVMSELMKERASRILTFQLPEHPINLANSYVEYTLPAGNYTREQLINIVCGLSMRF